MIRCTLVLLAVAVVIGMDLRIKHAYALEVPLCIAHLRYFNFCNTSSRCAASW